MIDLPATAENHRRLMGKVAALRLLEAGAGSRPSGHETRGHLRVAYWNAERFRRFDACCSLIRQAAPDVVLLGEVDIGMARTSQRHGLKDAAAALRGDYVFGTEFLELGLGDADERQQFSGLTNDAGLHGNGILSFLPLESPALIRLETDGDWFDGRHGERRVGGRCAVAAFVQVGAMRVLLVSVHLESHSGPQMRAEQMRRLFDAIDQLAPNQPVAIGGDLNTSTLTRVTTEQRFNLAPLLRDDPERLLRPQRYEPLFQLARDRGYDWQDANADGPTERRADVESATLGRIDWFLIRGLRPMSTTIIPALDECGQIISDHDMIAVTVGT